DLSPGALSGAAPVLHPVVRKQPERRMEPRPTPPLPAEASPAPRPRHMTPNLPLDPTPHDAEAPRRVADPEIVHPAPQDRVNHRDHPPHRLRAPAPELLLELPQQRRPLRERRRQLHPPPSPRRAEPPEGEAQKSERLSPGQVHDSALRLAQS